MTGETYAAYPYVVEEGFEEKKYVAADVILDPGVFRKFRWK